MKNILRISGVIILVLFVFLINSCKEKPTPPVLTTTAVTAISYTTATSGGEIKNDGGDPIASRGICWNTSADPTTSNSKTSESGGLGIFSSNIISLAPNTTYYVRAYGTNTAGTGYGESVTFTTLQVAVPVLTTTAITAITQTSAVSGGNITDDKGGAVSARGVCWGTTTSPTIANSKTTDATGTGSFVSNLTGLLSGTLYYVRSYATNSVGTAYGNEISFTTVKTIPGTPTIGSATAGNAQATVTFTPPVSNGGSAITGYTVTSSPGGITGTGFASPITVTGLTNGTAYTFTVTATNAIGTSVASSASNSVTPSTVPGAPTIGTATIGNAQVTVTFTPPVSNGGSAITGYTVTSSPGGIISIGSTSPITVAGLTNGTAYTFTVTATNAIGTSVASTATNSVIPVVPSTVPGTPTIGSATAGNAQATIIFSEPTSNGGSVITGYTVTSSPGSLTGTGTASPITVTGLTNGTAYTFTVTATNAIGTSVASAATNSVIPVVPLTAPGAPTIGSATAGNAQATVIFSAPVSNGGSVITGYIVTSSPGSLTGTGTASPITVAGLTNGTAYTFTVTATNAIGTSVTSSASNSVTPSTVPGAPTIGTATVGNAQATVTFTAPVSNGGTVITGYTVTSSPGNITVNGNSSPITVNGLTNGTAYTFKVTATNANGPGVSSSASNSVTPSTIPGTPTIGTATKGNGEATITFTAPLSDGGSAITTYTATSWPDNKTGTNTVSPIKVTGLTNGTAYTFTVTATNANGTSSPSGASNSVMPNSTVSGAPTIGTATSGNAQATIAFTTPVSDGGSAITGYTVTSSPGSKTGLGTASPVTVTGLTNGTAYTFTVTATNANGTSSASTASNSVTPSTVPGEPTIGTATYGDTQARVTFTAPISDGGSAITSYTVTSSPGGITGSGSTSPIIVTGLTNGTTYTFTVTATNDNGIGLAGAGSNSIIPAVIPQVTNPTTGKIWMDRNLGASQVATSSSDAASYGDLYQWGRAADGHQIRTSGTTTTLSSSNTPGHTNFIVISVSANPYDWRNPQNDNLWQGVSGTNNVCPSGYRLPTDAEWDAERLSWSTNTSAGAFASPLKLPMAGYRYYSNGSLFDDGSLGYYWSSTVGSIYSRIVVFGSGGAGMSGNLRAHGYSVRCVKD